LPGTQLYEKFKDKINLGYDYFDFLHWVYPTKITTKEFLRNLVRLYYSSYSFKRFIRITFKNLFIRIKQRKPNEKILKNINIIEWILLRLLAIPLHRKLYSVYKKLNVIILL